MNILTWNMRWGCGCDGHVDLDRIAAIIREFGAPDVICLQEVAVNHSGLTGSHGEDQVAELACRFSGYSAHYGVACDLPDDDGGRRLFGNLILSRLPVSQIFRHELPYPADPEYPSMPRMALEAVVRAPFGQLRIVTTHLEYYSVTQRLAQIEGLRQLHREAAGHSRSPRPDENEDPPFRYLPRPLCSVYCGDFNCEPDTPERARLFEAFGNGAISLRDAWEVLHPGLPHSHTVGLHDCCWPEYPYCCDYFLVTEDLVGRIRSLDINRDTDASDHQPLCLTLDPA